MLNAFGGFVFILTVIRLTFRDRVCYTNSNFGGYTMTNLEAIALRSNTFAQAAIKQSKENKK